MFGNLFNKIKSAVEGEISSSNTSSGVKPVPPINYFQVSGFENSREYSIQMLGIIDQVEQRIYHMNQAMDANDGQWAAAIREQWLIDFDYFIQQARDLGDFNGITALKEGGINYLQTRKKLVDIYYGKLVQLRIEGKGGNDEYQDLLDEYNDLVEDALNEYNDSVEVLSQENNENDVIASQMYFEDQQQRQAEAFGAEQTNPELFSPIHGISLFDYAAGNAKIANGVDEAEVLKAFGIEKPLWDEANQLWVNRMQKDEDWHVTTAYGQYFSQVDQHPKVGHLQANQSSAVAGTLDNEHLARLKTDEAFYHELSAARNAAYEVGMDGAQWILKTYGVSIGDFQAVAMQWMNSPNVITMMNRAERIQEEYRTKFLAEQGGGVADDIEF